VPFLPDPRRPGRLALLRTATVLLAVLTATTGLGRQPLWFDELASAQASGLPWSGLRVLLGQTDANLGAYYALLHLWRLVGDSALVLRLPSALAAVATVVLVERVGRRLLGPGPAVLAAALLAVHPFAVAYARDARPYALVALCTTAALLLGLRARERPTAARLLAYAVPAGCAVYLHLFAVLVVAAYALALLPPAGPARRRWAAVHAGLAAAVLPLLAISLRQQQQIGWVPALSPARVVSGLSLLAGGALPLLAVVAATGVLLTGHVVPRPERRVLLLCLLLPVAALVMLSAARPTFVPRYLLTTVPVQCLVLAGAAGSLRDRLTDAPRRAAGVAVLAGLTGALAVGTVLQVAAPFHYEDYRAASRVLLAGARLGDAVVYVQQGPRLGLDYYLPRERGVGGPLPADVLAVPGGRPRGFSVPELTGAAALRALAPYHRVWLVSHVDAAPRALALPLVCAARQRFGSVAVALCSARATP